MHRTHPSRLFPLLIAGLLLAIGLQTPAEAAASAVSRSLSVSAPTAGLIKTSVKFSGKVSRSPRGSTIAIQRRSGTHWVTVRTTRTTTTTGTYGVLVPLPTTIGIYTYRALAPAKGKLRAAGSRAVVIRAITRVSASLKATPSTVPAGSDVTLTGVVRPSKTNTLVTVQKFFNGSWTNVTTATIASNGAFSKTLNVGPTTQIRAMTPQVDLYATSYSNTVTVTTTPVIATQTLPSAVRTVAYSAKLITIDGSPGTWTASPLPDGLTLNPSTGVISGVPSTVQFTSTEIGFTKAGTGELAPTKTIGITVNQAPAPVITTTSLTSGNRTRPYSMQLTAQGSPAGTWTADPLPAGLSLNASTGLISGTPTAVGDTDVTVGFKQTSTGLFAVPHTMKLHVDEAPAPVIATTSLPNAKRLSTYSTTLAAQGGPAGTWTAAPLPDGLSLNASTGVISGTPTTVGSTNVVLGFTETVSGISAAPKTLTLQVVQADPPVITTSSLPDGKRLSAYSATAAVQGNPAGTWSATGLPNGLSIDPGTGEIFGTPTVVFNGTVTLTFTQTSTGVAGTKALTLKILQADPPVIATTTLPTADAGTPYSTTLTATGNPAGTWSADPLPAGLSLNTATGVISGTPTTSGSTNVVIGFTQTSTSVAATQKTIALKVLPGISNSTLAGGTVGSAYSVDLQAVDSEQTGTWTATPLPAGLSLNAGTGVISGTPTTAGSTDVVITFKNTRSALTSGSKTLTIAIKPAISTGTLPVASAGVAYSTTLASSGNNPGTWSASPLPAGLSLNAGTGVISGTPTDAGSTQVTIGFTSGGQSAATKTLALVVRPVVTTSSLPDGTDGAAYSVTLTAVGGDGTWSASPLPDGLTLDTGTGVISGTPTDAGSTNVVIGYTSNGQVAATKTLALKVKPVITTSSLPTGSVGASYSTTLAASGAGTWSASPLPDGLSLNTDTGVISGAPTTAGTTSVVIGFTRNGVAAAGKTLTLAVKPVISTSSLPAVDVGGSYSVTLAAASGGSGTWTASPLPDGLSLAASTGKITGTPTTVGSTDVVVGFTSGGVAATSKTLTIAVRPVIATSSLPAGTVGSTYSTTLDATGSGTWTASPLPAGLSVNASTGEISGTPTTAGSTNVVIGYTSNGVAATTKTLALAVKPTITTASLPTGTDTAAYSVTLAASGGSGSWTATPLPAGLSLNTSTGVISGTPTTPGTTSVVIGFTSGGQTASAVTLPLAVRPAITTSALPDATRTLPYSVTLAADNSPSISGTWTASPLPNGLSLNASTGVISGTPTAVGTTNVVIGFTANGVAASKTLSLTVDEAATPVITTSALPTGTRISPYSVTLSAQGDGSTAGTWTASPLPDGLSLDASSGVISGTPTTVQSVDVVLGFTQSSTGLAAAPKTLTLQVVQAAAPVISTTSLPSTTVNTSGYSTTLTATGNPAGTWTASPLPAGLTLNASTGVISGTPTASGTTAVQIGFTQTSTGVAATPKTLNLVVGAAITTTSLPDGTRTLSYSAQAAAAGTPTGTWTATNLPDGLAISSSGAITGTPTTVGTTNNVVLRFTQTANGGAPQVSKTLSITIAEVPAPTITTSTLNAATVNSAYTSNTPAVTTTGPPAGTWSATGLPAGLSISSSTGVISGTPTASGTSSVVLKFTQTSSGFSDTATIPLIVNAVITTSALPDGTRTLTYGSFQLAAAGTPAGTWAADNLPAGLSITNAGVISGTPSAVGNATVTVKFTQTANGGAPQVTKDLSLTVNEVAGPQITTSSLDPSTVNVAYTSATPAVTTTGPAAGTWSATGLPAGLSISASTGVISGTPTASGTSTVVLKFVQTSSGLSDTANLSLLVNAAITTASLPDGTRTIAYPSTTVHAVGDPAGTWSATNLPAGLSISGAGVITGTPSGLGTSTVTLKFTQTANGGAPQVTKDVSLTVNEVSGPNITTSSLNAATVSTAYTSNTPAVTTTGPPAGTWSATGLPAGLSVSASTGVISGTPTASGTSTVVLKFVQTSSGLSDTANLSLLVNAAITTASLPDGTRTLAYPSTTVHAVGDPAGTWSATNLPAGLSISGAGVITGTPTATGTKAVTLKFTQTANGGAPQVTATVNLTVDEADAPTITTTSLPAATTNQPYSTTVDATGPGDDTGTWSATGLPDGVTISSSTGAITGTPTVADTYAVVLTFTQTSTGLSDQKTLSLTVSD